MKEVAKKFEHKGASYLYLYASLVFLVNPDQCPEAPCENLNHDYILTT